MAAEPVKKPASSDLAKKLTQKLGPLPVWAWAASALVLVYAYRKNKASTAATAAAGSATPTAADQTSGLTSDGGLMGSGAAGAGAGFGSGMANPNAPLPYDSSIPYDFNPWSYQNGSTTTNVPADATAPYVTTDAGPYSTPLPTYTPTANGSAAFTQPGPGGIPLQVYGTPPTTAQTAATGTPGSTLSGPPAPAILSAVPNGSTGVKLLPSGAVTYVTSGGATVEKAPGMTPYVIQAAPAAAAPKAAATTTPKAIPNNASAALRKIGI